MSRLRRKSRISSISSTITSSNNDATERLKLAKVLGNTVESNNCVAFHPIQHELVAYAAGCVVVVFDTNKRKQAFFLNSNETSTTASTKTSISSVSCLSFSPDGEFLAVGSKGKIPSLIVYHFPTRTVLTELKSHKYGIACCKFAPFAPNRKATNIYHLVTIGDEHDGTLNLWKLHIQDTEEYAAAKLKASSLLASSKVTSMTWSMDFINHNTFVTCGHKHVKYWTCSQISSSSSSSNVFTSTSLSKKAAISGRNAILKDYKNETFCDVTCCHFGSKNQSNMFVVIALTTTGKLCVFSSNRSLRRHVQLKSEGHCITSFKAAMSDGDTKPYIAVGTGSGNTRIFEVTEEGGLQYFVALPRAYSHLSVANNLSNTTKDRNGLYPNIISFTVSASGKVAATTYSDGSFVVLDNINKCASRGNTKGSLKWKSEANRCVTIRAHADRIWDFLPLSSGSGAASTNFATCSEDGSIKLWNVADKQPSKNYPEELMGSIFTDEKFSAYNKRATTSNATGIRSVVINKKMQHLASGDRAGTLKIFDLKTLQQTVDIQAHDADILSLHYSKDGTLLATASRDRLIHIFKCNESNGAYDLLCTLDDHSSSITALRFASVLTPKNSKPVTTLISSSADKSIVFRKIIIKQKGSEFIPEIKRYHNQKVTHTVFDLQVLPSSDIIAGGKDKKIYTYSSRNGQVASTLPLSQGATHSSHVFKLQVDDTQQFVIVTSSDRKVRIYNLSSSKLVAEAPIAHSELLTASSFSSSAKRLFTVSGDGCIMLWKVPDNISRAIEEARKTRPTSSSPTIAIDLPSFTPETKESLSDEDDEEDSTTAVATIDNKPSDQVPTANSPAMQGSLPSWISSNESEQDLSSILPETPSRGLPSWATAATQPQQSQQQLPQPQPQPQLPQQEKECFSLFGGGDLHSVPLSNNRLTIEPSEVLALNQLDKQSFDENSDNNNIGADDDDDEAISNLFGELPSFSAFATSNPTGRVSISQSFRIAKVSPQSNDSPLKEKTNNTSNNVKPLHDINDNNATLPKTPKAATTATGTDFTLISKMNPLPSPFPSPVIKLNRMSDAATQLFDDNNNKENNNEASPIKQLIRAKTPITSVSCATSTQSTIVELKLVTESIVKQFTTITDEETKHNYATTFSEIINMLTPLADASTLATKNDTDNDDNNDNDNDNDKSSPNADEKSITISQQQLDKYVTTLNSLAALLQQNNK